MAELHRHGCVILVDDSDLDLVSGIGWCIKRKPWTNYAFSNIKGKYTLMHRFILGDPPTKERRIVDHIDRNGLNNQRSNLRWVTTAENNRNRQCSGKGSSKYLGVWSNHSKGPRKWSAAVRHDGVRYRLGSFISEIEAAKAYDAKAIQLHGEFANLNFPMEANQC